MTEKKTTEEILYDAVDAVDSALSVLMLARSALVDRIKEIPDKQSPTMTMGSPAPTDCQHRNKDVKELMGGVSITWCHDCGEQL